MEPDLTERLLAESNEVVALDNLDPYDDLELKRYNLERCREAGADRFSFVNGSITDGEFVSTVIAKNDVDIVFHEAATTVAASRLTLPRCSCLRQRTSSRPYSEYADVICT